MGKTLPLPPHASPRKPKVREPEGNLWASSPKRFLQMGFQHWIFFPGEGREEEGRLGRARPQVTFFATQQMHWAERLATGSYSCSSCCSIRRRPAQRDQQQKFPAQQPELPHGKAPSARQQYFGGLRQQLPLGISSILREEAWQVLCNTLPPHFSQTHKPQPQQTPVPPWAAGPGG